MSLSFLRLEMPPTREDQECICPHQHISRNEERLTDAPDSHDIILASGKAARYWRQTEFPSMLARYFTAICRLKTCWRRSEPRSILLGD